MSSTTSRTGLLPTPKRQLKIIPKQCKSVTDRLPAKFEAMPVALSLRPFSGLFNPFAKGCSVLCNHPAPTAVRDIIHHIKLTLATEAKNAQHHQKERAETSQPHYGDPHDNIPEDLFRRYTDIDSRPLTPSPTVTSVRTRTSAGSFLNNRRCITPELGKNDIIKRKKIILDLRRSHSQETLSWKPSSDISQSATEGDAKPKSAGACEVKKPKCLKSEDQQRPKSSLATSTIPEEGFDEAAIKKAAHISANTIQTCINEHQLDDEDVRRGKRRKKLKPRQAAAATTATFYLSEDPETQVATLGPDSVNPSTRPSLIPNAIASLLPNKDKRESEPVLLNGSFLTDDAFQALKTELDVDVIENTFGRYLNRALREAIKYIPPKAKVVQDSSKVAPSEIVKKFSYVTQSKMPRKFSKSATRFDVPLDLKSLETMSALDYLSKYVWVSRQRKQLYKRAFLKYVKNYEDTDSGINIPVSLSPSSDGMPPKGDENLQSPAYGYKERTMPMKCLRKALEDVLEFHGTEKNINSLMEFLEGDMLKSETLDFRTWCGVVSFAERLALDDPNSTDSCDELEKADFNSMEQFLHYLNISPILRRAFKAIRQTHHSNK